MKTTVSLLNTIGETDPRAGKPTLRFKYFLFGTILAGFVMMLLHRVTAWISFHNKKAGSFFKGKKVLLMKDGQKHDNNLSKTLITEEDILEALRHDVNTASPDKIKEVYLERSGNISFVKE